MAPGGVLLCYHVPQKRHRKEAYIEKKIAMHPAWPTFNTPHGKAMRYGPGCCPRTAAIFDRVAVIPMGVRDTPADLDQVAAAIRKAHGRVFG